jgi:hypothetical protein
LKIEPARNSDPEPDSAVGQASEGNDPEVGDSEGNGFLRPNGIPGPSGSRILTVGRRGRLMRVRRFTERRAAANSGLKG